MRTPRHEDEPGNGAEHPIVCGYPLLPRTERESVRQEAAAKGGLRRYSVVVLDQAELMVLRVVHDHDDAVVVVVPLA